jgi:hypothetical protein
MIQPRRIDPTIRDYPEEFTVWALEGRSGRYLAIRDRRFPGRIPIRFFTSDYDASRVLEAILEVRPELADHGLITIQVRLIDALRKIAADKTPPRPDSYVVHTPSEVFDFISQLRQKVSGE